MPDLSLQHRFELITAPAAEPITVTDAKSKCGLSIVTTML